MERFTGADAALWHLETPETPLHTLKVAVLDSGRRYRPVTVAELTEVVGSHLGLIRRSTQRVAQGPGYGGRPFWVDVPAIELSDHIEHVALPAPGDRRQLDLLFGRLATAPLPPDRPLWAMTLVDGLQDGRQAVVVRVHHAITDGLGALNGFLAATADRPGAPVPPCPQSAPVPSSRGALRLAAACQFGPWLVGGALLARDASASYRRGRAFRRGAPDLPPFLGSRRTFCNTRSGARRVCASSSLPFPTFRSIATATGTTVNGVLHAVIAGALRAELIERGESPSPPAVAIFGIAVDREDDRRWGNKISPTTVALFTDRADAVERLVHTARSCREGVELRRTTGLEMAGRWNEYTPRVSARFQRAFADVLPRIVNHVTTANLAGPRSSRWFGDIEVVDWYSFAVAVPPSNVNLTVYSYNGRMNIGLVTVPEVFEQPSRFLDRMAEELEHLFRCTAEVTTAT